MTTSHPTPATGTVLHLADSSRCLWAQGEPWKILAGTLSPESALLITEGIAWDWRLCVASIEEPGEFSLYDGFERTLTVMTGELLELDIDGTIQPLTAFRPLRFHGGAAVWATPSTGAVLVLNLITRTNKIRGSVRIVKLSKTPEPHLFGAQFGVLLQGTAEISCEGTKEALQPQDTLIGGELNSPRVSGCGYLAVVSLELC